MSRPLIDDPTPIRCDRQHFDSDSESRPIDLEPSLAGLIRAERRG
jgi:hypothetical protein